MKRHALLLGYSGGGSSGESFLSGVSQDLKNYKNFLMSSRGGGWFDTEITVLENTSKTELQKILTKIKNEQYNISIVVFSGHGDFENKYNNCRELLINSKKETILEKELYGLSSKEILICDCCASYRYTRDFSEDKSIRMILNEDTSKKKLAREKYETLIIKCPNQKLRFYAAKPGNTASDTEKGGLYMVKLLEVLNETKIDINIVDAHDKAYRRVLDDSSNEQVPSKRVDKVERFLPGAIII